MSIVILIIEIHAIIFTLTGVKKTISRFQVLSMMTGTGFTTEESELILGHPVRRKLSMFLIVFGIFSFAVIITSLSTILTKYVVTVQTFYIAGIILILYVLLQIPVIQRHLKKKLQHETKQSIEIKDLPIHQVFLREPTDHLMKWEIDEHSIYRNQTITSIFHPQEDIHVLFVKRGDRNIRSCLGELILQEGDELLLYGEKHILEEKFLHYLNQSKE
ncbi:MULTISPECIES: TrkA C-terminal domain-containing protein [unclassified Bacillus cereus group]|uniref:TrkA C-terminal domain-containing protein n=1 Tax=unclassified Bacillus cereus group TaxID=2750818 RepID=UPI001F5ACFF9|nr:MULTISPECIES: TrkA C-terminal domain-containing protein [unclassified Bacillus cereus group]